MKIEKAHLYVEKYSKLHQELLLDFILENEFIYFQNNGDYLERMHLEKGQYEPTMLLLHGCAPARKLREGAVLTVDMDKLLTLRSALRNSAHDTAFQQSYPATVYLEVDDGAEFAQLIDDPESTVSNRVHRRWMGDIPPTWSGPPCALENMRDDFELCVWNVGQGNTNSIADPFYLTLFDFGASIYNTKAQLERILQDHAPLFANKASISMILSHWDCDHFNLLCAVDNSFLEHICCIFYPPGVMSLTARQIAERIKLCCKYRVQIAPAPRRVRNRCGIHAVYEGERYTLFTGENSSNRNHSGLLLALYSKTQTALLTADHSNYQVWDRMYAAVRTWGQKTHIVVPHHGGDCGRLTIPNVTQPGVAAVSVGSNNYHHPRPATLNEYRHAGYHVIRTDRCGSDVTIPMN